MTTLLEPLLEGCDLATIDDFASANCHSVRIVLFLTGSFTFMGVLRRDPDHCLELG
jgi:hypothetical protein